MVSELRDDAADADTCTGACFGGRARLTALDGAKILTGRVVDAAEAAGELWRVERPKSLAANEFASREPLLAAEDVPGADTAPVDGLFDDAGLPDFAELAADGAVGDDVESAELVVSAKATAAEVPAITAPTPSATASAPTRPT